MLQAICKNKIPFAYELNDLWFASAENMRFVKLDLQKEFIMALKSNRKAAVSEEEHASGKYQRIDQRIYQKAPPSSFIWKGFPFLCIWYARSLQTKMAQPVCAIW
jgi:hypothetical protein